MCLLARVGLITPAARDAARRRQVAMRLEGQMREESTVDGLPPGTWLGQERPMSWPVKQHVDALILTLSKIQCRIENLQIHNFHLHLVI